jgi:anthranilate synthase component 2
VKVLLVDFYDSFTFNIEHYLNALDVDVTVVKDDDVNLDDIVGFDAIILSPGPGLPNETKNLFSILDRYASSHRILGVCLGMQGIAQYFKAELYNLNTVYHGKVREISVKNKNWLFTDLHNEINVGLYHSWAVKIDGKSPLRIAAQTYDGIIMAIEHEKLPICGVQFHPESILTENGIAIFKNFLFQKRSFQNI